MKKLIFTLLLSLCLMLAKSQNTAYLKVADNGYFEKIEKVSSGGFISVGMDSAYKIQVVRWDAGFNIQWKYTFTDANISAVRPKVVEANDGNFYFMAASLEHTSSTYIVKFSPTGTLLWQKVYYISSGNLYSFALSKALAGDNGFLFGGGQCTLTNYIIKCSPDGTIEWQYQYNYTLATGVTTCWSIIPDGTEYVVASGFNAGSLLTFKIGATGSIISNTAYTYTGMQINPIRIVKLKSNGGYALVGNYNNSNDNKTEFVAFYNNALSLQSFNELTVTYTQFELWDITAVSNGKNVIVDGSIYDASAFTDVMINLSNTGSIVWKKRSAGNTSTTNKNMEFRGLTSDGNNSVHVGAGMNEGRVIAVIDSNGNGLCNDLALTMNNVHRTLALESGYLGQGASIALSANVNYTHNNTVSYSKQIYCGSLSGIDDNNDMAAIGTLIFPNPATNSCTISFDVDKISANSFVSVYNISGQMVYSSQISEGSLQMEIDLNHFMEGLYLVQISSEQGIIGKGKMMVMR